MSGGGSLWNFSVPFSQFCCEPKTVLKRVILKDKKTGILDTSNSQLCGLRFCFVLFFAPCDVKTAVPIISVVWGFFEDQITHEKKALSKDWHILTLLLLLLLLLLSSLESLSALPNLCWFLWARVAAYLEHEEESEGL